MSYTAGCPVLVSNTSGIDRTTKLGVVLNYLIAAGTAVQSVLGNSIPADDHALHYTDAGKAHPEYYAVRHAPCPPEGTYLPVARPGPPFSQ
ncbi:uncharacterized protein SPSK_10725 [Sporothrix schenckii 1099-18]|uniref:Uncharacterized protein n=1 Tax=Sporothrix schenckii 1099-18 TaxID=1397361 RepID=A0A0F2MJ57_SPOSC|nr:uncharacterized protein SPSK_10725 [Sporothrix schenckii 1099-18]KJR89652.1 hypothetical protein SPSK_10725 [Sporothrix schenckii 1099-18]